MSEHPPAVDLSGVLQMLVQQQTAILQQQAALMHAHGESVRLQALLIEHVLGRVSESSKGPNAAAEQPPPSVVVGEVAAAPAIDVARTETSSAAPEPLAQSASISTVSVDAMTAREPTAAPAERVEGGTASRAARYYQFSAAHSASPSQPQDLELMRRLHELRGAGSLILQFGPHKGATLAQVAMSDPAYVRQLVTRALRPEVRAAAGQVVSALEAAAEHKPRAARAPTRRSRTAA